MNEPDEFATPALDRWRRFGIRHVFYITAAWAVLLALALDLFGEQLYDKRALKANVVSLVAFSGTLILAGLMLVGIFVWIEAIVRRISFPIEPGEWLWVIAGWNVCGVCLTYYGTRGSPSSELVEVLLFAVWLAGSVISIAAVQNIREEPYYGPFLGLIAALHVILAVFTIYTLRESTGFWGPLVLANIALLATCIGAGMGAVQDLKQPQSRGFFHWTGCVSLAMLGVWVVASSIIA